MATRKKTRRSKRGKQTSTDKKMFAVLSGKSRRVVATASTLDSARKKARAMKKRGSKRVSIRRGSKTYKVGGRKSKRTSRKSARRRSRRTSRKSARRRSRRRSR